MKYLVLISILLPVALVACESKIDKSTVKDIDIERYMGKWYEIARFENKFQRGMNSVEAQYTLNEDGTIKVVNSGIKPNTTERSEANGRGKVPNTKENGKLKVSFFLWFWSVYLILELDKVNYSYAVVGSSTDKYLWILSRTPTMDSITLDMLINRIEQRGYDINKLIYTGGNF